MNRNAVPIAGPRAAATTVAAGPTAIAPRGVGRGAAVRGRVVVGDWVGVAAAGVTEVTVVAVRENSLTPHALPAASRRRSPSSPLKEDRSTAVTASAHSDSSLLPTCQKLVVTDGAGLTDDATVEITVKAPPTGSIVVDPNHPAWFTYDGGGPFFMCGPGDPEDFLQICGRLVRFMESTRFNETAPADGLARGNTDYVLANPGRVYFAYGDSGTSLGLNVQAGGYRVKWFDPADGDCVDEGIQTFVAGDYTFTKPGSIGGEAVLYLVQEDAPPTRITLTLTETNEPWGEVLIFPEPNDPQNIRFLAGTPVTSTGLPAENKEFRQWGIMDPNQPDDANFAMIDTNTTTTIVLNEDMHVNAVWKWGGGISSALPIAVVALLIVTRARRRSVHKRSAASHG